MIDKVRATSSDVAKLAGVSRSAVSRAFTDDSSVSDATRRKVLTAAETLGYRPNVIARMLNKRGSDIVGVLLGSLTNQFLTSLSSRLLDAIHEGALRPLLFQMSSRSELEDQITSALQYQVASLVIVGFTPPEEIAQRCNRLGVPVIVVNRAIKTGYPVISIATDHYQGGRLAAEVLQQSGAERIATIMGDPSMSTHSARLRGLLDRLAELGMSQVGGINTQMTHEAGHAAAIQLMQGANKPDAIFCSGDILAFGALDALRFSLGLAVPRDVGVLGFDDLPVSSWPGYNLSTIRQPVEGIVAEVMGMLNRMRSKSPTSNVSLLLGPEYVSRGTLNEAGTVAPRRAGAARATT